jgi:hypothetical protein
MPDTALVQYRSVAGLKVEYLGLNSIVLAGWHQTLFCQSYDCLDTYRNVAADVEILQYRDKFVVMSACITLPEA